jgi:hypothetical protein
MDDIDHSTETRMIRKADLDRLIEQVDQLAEDRIERNARIKSLEQQLQGAVEALRVCADRLTHGPLPGNEDWYERAQPFLSTANGGR